MSPWKTTVDSLVRNYLEALNALIPSMKTSRILSDQLVGLDDWTRACDMLFNLLVVEPIRSAIPPDRRQWFDLPAYDTEYESYEDFSLITVHPAGKVTPNPPSIIDSPVLLRFLPSEDTPPCLSVVETVRLDKNLSLADDSYASQAVDSARFTCLVPREDGGWERLEEIEVNLD